MALTGLTEVLDYLRKTCAVQQARDLSDGQLLERFLADREQAAFTVLVQRHGPMVFSVCKRVLGDGPGAEDAFQATFLVLVRRAASISTHRPLGNWLYAVAQRIAMRERAQTATRRNRESRLADMPRSEPLDESTWQELRGVLDEEIARLPQKYQAPMVLCYFEGMSQDRAAKQLGWAKGSLARRLERGRELLRQQLVRRGIGLSVGALLTALAEKAAAAPVDAFLTINTVKASMAVAAGKAIAGGCLTAKALILAEGARAMEIGFKAKIILLAMTMGLTLGSAGLAVHGALVGNEQPAAVKKAQAPPPKMAKSGQEQKKQIAATDLYGDPLPDDAIARLGTIRLRHAESVSWAKLTPDGKTLVSEGGDGVRFWKADTGEQLHFIPKDPADKTSQQSMLSADGTRLAIPGKASVAIWDVPARKEIKTVGDGSYGVARLSPDGKLLAVQSATQPWPFEIWDLATGQMVCSGGGDKAYFSYLEFMPDGKTLITAGSRFHRRPPLNDYKISFWDAATGKELRQFPLGTINPTDYALSPDGKFLAFRPPFHEPDNRIRIWDTGNGKEITKLDPVRKSTVYTSKNYVVSFTFLPDSRTLLTSGVDGVLIEWNAATGEELRRVGADMFPRHMAITPDSKTVAVCEGFTAIRLIELSNGKDRILERGHVGNIFEIAVTPDGRTVLTRDAKCVLLWNGSTGEKLNSIGIDPGITTKVLFTDKGQNLMTMEFDADRILQIRRVRALSTGKEVRSNTWDENALQKKGYKLLSLTADGKMMAMAKLNASMVLADCDTGKEFRSFNAEQGENLLGAAFSADGSRLMLWHSDGQIRAWTVAEGLLLSQFRFTNEGKQRGPLAVTVGGGLSYKAALSPDGRLAAFGERTDSVAIHDLATGRLVHLVGDFADFTYQLAFSADGRYLAWGGYRTGDVRLVEVASGRHCHSFAGRGGAHAFAFSADGKALVSAGFDTAAMVWDLTGQHTAKGPLAKKLTASDLETCWTDLAGEDAARAFQAIRRLAAAPNDAVPHLSARLTPVPAVDEKRLARLAVELDNDAFAVRQAAAKELEEIGDAAAGVLQKVLAGKPSLELSRRAQGILEKLAQAWQHPGPANLRILRALETLELAGTPEARAVLQRLAGGATGSWLTQEANAALKRMD